ncbi:hypothetical protein QA640_39155 [Bradyrhizobium sp. CB82]|nr:hypothetical protein [Bradyrhizobium sp. CB82]WFU40166.1 hypothetical protein QA640_39155 [Bradyrhizobium sp. CB82]
MQTLLRRYDLLRGIDPKRFTAKGEEQVTLLLRTVFESSNGAAALTVPILRAVSGCMHKTWVEKGLAFIEAYDRIHLVGLHGMLTDLGLEDQLERVLRHKLKEILGSPLAPAAPKKTPRPNVARMAA